MRPLELAVRSRSPLILPRVNGADRVVRGNGPWLERLLVIEDTAMILRIRPDGSPPASGPVEGRSGPGGRGSGFVLAAIPVDPDRLTGPGTDRLTLPDETALAEGINRLRHNFGLDDDLDGFRDSFRDDPRLGPTIRRHPTRRPSRRAVAWEALLWAITEQLIEYRRAAAIQRRMIRRWGIRLDPDSRKSGGGKAGCETAGSGSARGSVGRRSGCDLLATVPSPEVVSGIAPAELQACDLGARRAVAMIRVAREVSAGRVDPDDPGDDRRLLTISDIGPWTLACLGLRGRGDPDALLAGDLGQVKLVGKLAGLGRLATIEEVERFYASYAPWRGLAGELLLAEAGAAVHGPGNRDRIRQSLRPAA